MRHWLLRAILVLGAILGISIPIFSSTVNPFNRIDPIAPIVSPEQKGEPQPLSLPPASRLSSVSGIPNVIGRRGGIRTQELSSDLHVHYHIFRTFAPSWSAVSTLAEFWFQLAMEVSDVPDRLFHQNLLSFSSGKLRLEMYNMSVGTSGIPRQFVQALANAMLAYTHRGFCGMFNARVSGTGRIVGGLTEGVTLWVTLRAVEGFGEAFGV